MIGMSALVVGLAAMWFASGKNSVIFMAGGACLVVSLFWFLQAGILARNIFQVTRREKQIAQRQTEAAAQAAAKKPVATDRAAVTEVEPTQVAELDNESPTLIATAAEEKTATDAITADATDGEDAVDTTVDSSNH